MQVRCVMAMVVLAAAAACTSPEVAARQYIERGDRDAAAGRDEAAVIDYRNAAKANPSSVEAQRKLGDAYVVVGRSDQAYAAYLKAEGDPAAQIGLGKLLLASGQYEEAKMRAESALQKDPTSVDAKLLAATAVAETKALGGDLSEAEAAFKAAVATAPQSSSAHVAFARFLLAAERPADAEAELRKALAAAPHDELANRAMAAFCQAQDRVPEAERYFKEAAAAPHQKYRSTIAFADYLMEARRYDDARAVLLRVTTDGSLPPMVRLRLAAIAYDTGSHDKAHAMLDGVLKHSTTGEGLGLKARFLAAEGRTADALAVARAALDLDPAQPAANLVVGTIAAREGRSDEAEHAFREILRLKPWNRDAKLQLARVKLAQGDATAAVDLAGGAGVGLDARLTLAQARAAGGDIQRARQELTDLSRAYPSSAAPIVALAGVELEQGDRAAARALGARAITVAPTAIDAELLSARLALGDGDRDAAEQWLTRAVAQDPQSFDARAMLGQVRAERGDLAGALQIYHALAADYPTSASARSAEGLVLEAAGRGADARKAFEDSIALDPNDFVAAAHLARYYADEDANVMTAVRLGQRAIARMPDDAEAHDTLGRAYLKSGKAEVATHEFERAVALDAQNQTYRSHLAAARKAAADEAAEQAAMAKGWR